MIDLTQKLTYNIVVVVVGAVIRCIRFLLVDWISILLFLDWCQCFNDKEVGSVLTINLLGLVFVFVFSTLFCSPPEAQLRYLPFFLC